MYHECSTREEENSYYQHCKEVGIPFVYIRKRRKYATVGYDMLPVSMAGLTKESTEDIRQVWREFREAANDNPGHKQPIPSGSSGQTVGYLENVLIADADACADAISEIVFDVDNWTNFNNTFLLLNRIEKEA